MHMFRPKWDDIRIEREWCYLEALTPEAEKKHNGPTEAPLQLPIPGWFVGDDGEVTEHENFETKQVSTATKAQVWKPEDLVACLLGFVRLFRSRLCGSQSVRPTVRPSVRPSDRPSVCPFDRSSARPLDRPSARPSDRPSVRIFVVSSSYLRILVVSSSYRRIFVVSSSYRRIFVVSSSYLCRIFVRPTVRPFARSFVRPCVRLSDRSSRLSDRPSVRTSIRPSVRPTVRPSVRPTVLRSSN